MSQKHLFVVSTLSLSIGLALVAPLRAEEAAVQPTIEVTASRIAETVDASLADVSVITRADIEASHAPDVFEVLRLQPGLDVVRTGGAGEQTNIFLRGTNSNHVLVLIDGVRVASSNTGAFAFENLPLDAVERIEIVRGPRASYWGSDAIGGVIQIFTRKLEAPLLAASYGSYRSADGSAGIGGWSDAGGFSVQVGARHVHGFSATNPGICTGPTDTYCIYDPDNDGMQNHNAVVQGVYKLGAQTLSASVFRNEGSNDFDQGRSHTLDQAVGINWEGAVTADWQQRLSVGTSREDIDTPAFASAYRSTREQASWTNEVAVAANQHVVAGLDYTHDHGISVDTSGFGAPYDVSRNNSGAFAGWRVQQDALDGELSGRYDHNSQFGSAFSGSAAAGWKIDENLRLMGSYGTAFRAPNLGELYSPGYGGYYAGNALLDPERSRTAELSLDWRVDGANRLGVRTFATRVHDLVDFSGGSTFQAINVKRATIDGVELTQAWHGGDWSVDTNATLQNPRNTATDEQLLRRAKRKLNTVVERAFGTRFRLGTELVVSGKRDDVAAVTLPGYVLLNLRASYALGDDWRIGARLENAFDRFYELAHGYNTPGRSGYLEIAWAPAH
jgi:vitamin B12 transporter